MALSEWSKLLCDCGSDQFIQVVSLQYHEGQGTSPPRVEGFQCVSCKKKCRQDKMIKDLQLKKKKAEFEALRQEIEPEPEKVKTSDTPSAY